VQAYFVLVLYLYKHVIVYEEHAHIALRYAAGMSLNSVLFLYKHVIVYEE
jgi:hypothetical protein